MDSPIVANHAGPLLAMGSEGLGTWDVPPGVLVAAL